jgi:hypothetical protein
MMKSARVTLTILAAVGSAAHAQQPVNPCAPSTFNPAACKTAVKLHGFCNGAIWVPQRFQQYPYYYGLYATYASSGGPVDAPLPSSCSIPRGGFGSHGVAAQSRVGS